MSDQFKIRDVRVINWNPPGKKWWDNVEEKSEEPLIHAIMDIEMSFKEYRKLLDKDRED